MEEDTNYARFVGIALVVVKKNNQYASVEEHDGWYLPAGRVDYGEAFTTGGTRETLEEAGIPVRLTGIYRIEQYAMRMRVIFGAEPVDDTPLKTIPDSETLKAEWVTLPQLKQKKLRHQEVYKIFSWVDAGAPLYPIDIYEGQNGNEIDNKNVVTKVLHTSKVVIQEGNLFLGIRKDDKIELLSQIMKNSETRQHKDNATKLLSAYNIPYGISGVYKVEHQPPLTKANPNGTLTFIFSTVGTSTLIDKAPLLWTEAQNFTNQKERTLLETIVVGKAPHAAISLVTLEGEGYS